MRNKGFILIIALLLVVPLAFSACGRKKVKAEPTVCAPPTGPSMSEEQLRALEMERQAREAFDNEMAHFDFNRYNIRPDAAEVLKGKADYMNNHPTVMVEVQGHCDNRGTPAYNMALGDRRAHSAKKFMMDLGIDSSRMSTVSYGEEMPLDPANNEYAWSMNRRAQFVVTSE